MHLTGEHKDRSATKAHGIIGSAEQPRQTNLAAATFRAQAHPDHIYGICSLTHATLDISMQWWHFKT